MPGAGRSNSGRSSSPTEPPQRTLANSPANILPELDLAGSVVPTVTLPYNSGRPHIAPLGAGLHQRHQLFHVRGEHSISLGEHALGSQRLRHGGVGVQHNGGVKDDLALFGERPPSRSNSSRAVWLEGNRKSWPARSRVVTISIEPARL